MCSQSPLMGEQLFSRHFFTERELSGTSFKIIFCVKEDNADWLEKRKVKRRPQAQIKM